VTDATLDDIFDEWKKNLLVPMELHWKLFMVMDSGNVHEIVKRLRPEDVARMIELAEICPTTDAEWQKTGWVENAGPGRRGVLRLWSNENLGDRLYRRGVEALRRYVANEKKESGGRAYSYDSNP
jgi:hypothetical protein